MARTKKDPDLKRTERIQIYLSKNEKDELKKFIRDKETEQNFVKRILNKVFNLNLKIAD